MINSALLLVDIQKDFCKNGALEVKEAEDIIPVANKLIDFFEKKEALVIGTKDWHPLNHKSFAINSCKNVGDFGELNGLAQVFWPIHCVQDTEGSQFHKDLKEIKNIIYKGENFLVDSYSAFFDNGHRFKTKLDDFLKDNQVKTLYIMGLATDYCVKFTVIDALELGYEVYLVNDGIKGVNLNPSDSQLAIEFMVENGAKLIDSNDINL